MARWTLSNASTTDTLTVNPNAGGSPKFVKRYDRVSTSAPDGSFLIFEGRPAAATGTFSGTLFSEAQLVVLQTWFAQHAVITVVDDLARSFDIVFTNFSAKRAPHRSSPWRHTYEVSYVLVTPAVI